MADKALVSSEVACPFCGLLCDDLTIIEKASEQFELQTGPTSAPLCAKASDGYLAAGFGGAQPMDLPSPRIHGKPASIAAAIDNAVEILTASQAPLIGGLHTDVNGARAAIRIAERIGAVIDHANSDAMLHNTQVIQRDGWVTTTLAEARNRADLIVVIGEQIFDRFPRLIERVLNPPVGLEPNRIKDRKVVLLGSWANAPLPVGLVKNTVRINVAHDKLLNFLNQLQACLANPEGRLGAAPESLVDLAATISAAHYAVIAWSGANLANESSQSRLIVETIARLIRTENIRHRVAGLPLAGSAGDLTVNQVCTWLTGFPVRTAFCDDGPVHDQARFAGTELIAQRRIDSLLWVASLDATLSPPLGEAPSTIVIGHPALKMDKEPEVYLPCGIPGIDHSGHFFRTDSVVSVPVKKIKERSLWPASEILNAIADGLGARPR